jgi:P4 family phage/plasmid primase-like protien
MEKEFNKYTKYEYVVFSIDIQQKKNKDKWKKDIVFPKKWTNFTLDNTFFNPKYNGLAILTGKINNIIVLDIDNVEHWENLLNKYKQKEPNTVKVISGSGGIHYYFNYTEELANITSKDHALSSEYDIDIKTNGGCVIIPPTSYFNKNLDNDVSYEWKNSIFDYDIIDMPIWIKNLLLNKQNNKKKDVLKEDEYDVIELNNNIEIDKEDEEVNFTLEDIEKLIDMLSMNRCNNYNDWVSVGMCLFNLNPKLYLYLWIKWSKKCDKYNDGDCEQKWKTFNKSKEGYKIGSLLLWCKIDNSNEYTTFIKTKKFGNLVKSKFPNDKLMLGDTINVSDKCTYTHIHNNDCLIKGGSHIDMPKSMYIEMLKDTMTIKCRHPECFGKIYPCQHIMLNKQEMNIAFHGDVNITINNYKEDDELVEFQQIDLYEDEKINELVFNSLNGEAYPCAKIAYHFYKNKFMYGEDENWYIFDNHKWKCIGKKNMELRDLSQQKMKDLYSDLLKYYKENEFDKKKIKTLKQTIKGFDNTNLKNNILVELVEIFTINNNPKRNFIKRLDSNNYLIGFENGVYDLNKLEFRDGNYDDYVTMSVGYNYNDTYSDKYKDLLKFLEDIQPNKEERDYMLTYLSIGLVGNLLELFTILTGCGRNGKSKIVELLKYTFGDYFGSVQSQMFTRPRPDANSPDPGLLSLMRKKIVMASEPEKNSKLNSGFIKFITGRDSTTLRNCHSNDMIDFTANFITFLICNDIPDCDDIDNAFSKRLRCVNFPTEFVLEPTKENQKKINVNINENFDLWKNDFMLLLIEYYKKYIQTKELKPTNNILKWTDQYKENTDIYLEFLNENTEENKEGHIHCSTLYENFKTWFKMNNPNTKIPSNKEFINNIKKYKDIIRIKIEGKSSLGIRNLQLI